MHRCFRGILAIVFLAGPVVWASDGPAGSGDLAVTAEVVSSSRQSIRLVSCESEKICTFALSYDCADTGSETPADFYFRLSPQAHGKWTINSMAIEPGTWLSLPVEEGSRGMQIRVEIDGGSMSADFSQLEWIPMSS